MKSTYIPSLFFALTCLSFVACDESGPVKSTDAVSDSKSAPVAPAPVDATVSGMGLKCVKKVLSFETTTYVAALKLDGVPVIATRAEKRVSGKSDLVSQSLSIDDGKVTKVYIKVGKKGRLGKAQSMPSAFAPTDATVALQMAQRMYGSCTDWEIDESKFRPSK